MSASHDEPDRYQANLKCPMVPKMNLIKCHSQAATPPPPPPPAEGLWEVRCPHTGTLFPVPSPTRHRASPTSYFSSNAQHQLNSVTRHTDPVVTIPRKNTNTVSRLIPVKTGESRSC